MKIYISIFVILVIFSTFVRPFFFGTERKPDNALMWLIGTLINAPALYALYWFVMNY